MGFFGGEEVEVLDTVSNIDDRGFLPRRTKKTRDSFSSRHSWISLRAKWLILSNSLSKRTAAAEHRGAPSIVVPEGMSPPITGDSSGASIAVLLSLAMCRVLTRTPLAYGVVVRPTGLCLLSMRSIMSA